MAKVWTAIKFTAEEKRIIDSAWLTLDRVADGAGTCGAQYLRDALRMETTGDHSVPTLAAKAMLCEWFSTGSAGTLARDLFCTRPASILIKMLSADLQHRDKVTAGELKAMRAAGHAKDDALKRMRDAANA